MEKYVSVNIVDAEPMYRRLAYEYGYHRVGADESILDQPNDYGYHLIYSNGYHSWCPVKEFEQCKKPINTLRKTAILMNSDKYEDKFVAEYKQLKIRCDTLKSMLHKWDNGIEDLCFTPPCSREIYDDQLWAMEKYLNILKKRAKIENIKL